MGTCGATCGITKERAKDLARAVATAETARARAGTGSPEAPRAVAYDALVDLARNLETLLPVRVHVGVGDAGECDSLYVLAGLHRPCLAEIAEHGDPLAAEPPARGETYVRVAVSPHGRFAVLQEVVASAEPLEDGWALVFEPQAGVVDRRLQHIVKGLQGALRKAKLVVLDLASVVAAEAHAPEDASSTLWSALFEGASPFTVRACRVPSG